MSIRALISPLAVAAVLALSGGASAQVMIDDFEISPESMPTFQQKCDALLVAENRSLTEDQGDVDETTTGSVAEPDSEASPDPASIENEEALLANLTIEQCQAAGLLP